MSRVPVVYRNVPPGLQITGDHDRGRDGARARLGESDLARFETDEVSAVVDLADAQAGQRRSFPLRTDQVAVPAGVEVMWVDPARGDAHARDSRARRRCPSSRRVDGQPAAGFVVGDITVDPKTVERRPGPRAGCGAFAPRRRHPVLDRRRANATVTRHASTSASMDGSCGCAKRTTARVTVTIVPGATRSRVRSSTLPVALRNLGDGPQRDGSTRGASRWRSARHRARSGASTSAASRRTSISSGSGPVGTRCPFASIPAPTFVVGTITPATV